MDTAAGRGGMERNAGGGDGMIRRLRAVYRGDQHVGLARRDHGNAVGIQRGTQAQGEGQHQILLEHLRAQARSTVCPSMRRVNHHQETRLHAGRGRWRHLRSGGGSCRADGGGLRG